MPIQAYHTHTHRHTNGTGYSTHTHTHMHGTCSTKHTRTHTRNENDDFADRAMPLCEHYGIRVPPTNVLLRRHSTGKRRWLAVGWYVLIFTREFRVHFGGLEFEWFIHEIGRRRRGVGEDRQTIHNTQTQTQTRTHDDIPFRSLRLLTHASSNNTYTHVEARYNGFSAAPNNYNNTHTHLCECVCVRMCVRFDRCARVCVNWKLSWAPAMSMMVIMTLDDHSLYHLCRKHRISNLVQCYGWWQHAM